MHLEYVIENEMEKPKYVKVTKQNQSQTTYTEYLWLPTYYINYSCTPYK